MELEYLPCPACVEVTLVEVPPCADGHDADCPDRACTVCGTALVVYPGVYVDVPRPDRVAA